MMKTLSWAFAMAATAAVAFGADNTLGSWKYNTEKSRPAPGVSRIANLTVTREAAEGGVKITAKGERADGSKIDTVTSAKYDRKQVPVTGSGLTWDMTALRQVNENTITEERSKTDGKYHSTARTVVSKDGKTMTSTTKGTGADGKPFKSVAVFDKQ